MTRNRKYLLGGIALAAMGLGAAGAMARQGGHGHHGMHHGGMFGFGPGAMRGVCRDGRAAEMADVFAVRLEHRVKPTEAQRAAFDELKTALKTGADKLKAGCPDTAAKEPPKEGERRKRPSPIERLANMETMTAARLDAIKVVRPAAEKLYAQLSDEQKQALTPERKGRWWNRGGRDGRPGRGDGPGRGPDGDGAGEGPDKP